MLGIHALGARGALQLQKAVAFLELLVVGTFSVSQCVKSIPTFARDMF